MNASTTPIRANFPVRRMDFTFSETPKYWWDGQPFMTHFMNNLSSLFPYGEKFFVDSVRAVRERIQDPQLQKDVSAFIGQEAMHSKEHAAYNEYADEHGIDLETLELRIKVLLESISKVTTKKHQLAITCALEHFTATMAEQLLKREDLSGQMKSDKMYKLWMWHAVEENEHKAVAYDVYQQVYGGYFTRTAVMLLTTVIFLSVIAGFQINLLRRDGQLFNWRSWKHGLGVLLHPRRGYFVSLIRPWLDYFRPGFHPFDHDTKALETRWKEQLDFAG
ncbi:metal-dependent hydrolase [Pseudomonas sp. AU11447]|uniref:metal-dependent hydrolase n=1 Tax=Pseudomonas TaxID=286 RepID=UPI0006D41C1F|nr:MULTISPECIES: metal-dependent hydrolase [Pseudomonas]OBY90111.1 metal-dependent hydrolase [Pseudomonas sp. AU11447]